MRRFGEVVKTSKCDGEETNPEKYLVEFSNVHGAEAALRGGLQFNDTVLTAEYFKPSTIDSSQEGSISCCFVLFFSFLSTEEVVV